MLLKLMLSPKVFILILIVALFIPCSRVLSEETTSETNKTELEEIVVTATKTKRPIEDVPASITVINSKEIETSGVHNIDDLFRLKTGLDVKRVTGMASASGAIPMRISIRGIPGPNRALILVDGMPLNGSGTGFINFNEIPTQNIARVEIVRGPFSSLYGANAASGVINIITKETQRGGLIEEAGNEDYHRAGFSLSRGSEDFSFSVTADTRQIENYLARDYIIRREWNAPQSRFITTKVDEVNHGYDDNRFNAKFSWNLGDDSMLTLLGRYFDSQIGFGQTTNLTAPQQDIEIKSKVDIVGFNLETELANRFPLELSGYYRNNRTRLWNEAFSHTNVLPPPPFGPIFVYGYDKNRYDDLNLSLQVSSEFDTQHKLTLINSIIGLVGISPLPSEFSAHHKLTLGLDNLWNHGKGEPTVNVTTGQPLPSAQFMSERIKNFGLFVQDEISISDQVSVVPAVRFDQHSEFGSATSPKIGGLYKLKEGTRVHVSMGRAFKAPTIAQLFAPDYTPSPGVIIRSNKDLDPEYITSYEVGFESRLGGIIKPLTARIGLFYNDMDDLISLSGTGIQEYKNITDGAFSRGVESELDWRATQWLTCFANHTYQATKDKGTREELDHMPGNKSSLGLRWNKPLGGWAIKGLATGIYVGRRDYEDRRSSQINTLPGYWKADLSFILTYKQDLGLRLSIQNATDKRYEDTGGYLAPGRLYSLGLDIKF